MVNRKQKNRKPGFAVRGVFIALALFSAMVPMANHVKAEESKVFMYEPTETQPEDKSEESSKTDVNAQPPAPSQETGHNSVTDKALIAAFAAALAGFAFRKRSASK